MNIIEIIYVTSEQYQKTIDRFEKVEKAEDEELVLGVTADVHGDAVTGGTSTESSRWSDWIPVFIFRYQTSRRQPRQIFW